MAEHLTQLRELLTACFDEEELHTLSADMGVPYEDLPAQGKTNKARELVQYLERRHRILDLVEICKRQRPHVAWAQVHIDDRMADYRTKRDLADQSHRERRARQRIVNLRPLDMTHTFKNRERERQDLCTHLAQGNVRLITIVGRGGMGKTALVSRVLSDLERGTLPIPDENQEMTIDGIIYLSARSTGLSLERIYADVGRMLGEPIAGRLAKLWTNGELPLIAKIEYLLDVMQDGLYLILLDNLEDSLAEDGTVAEEGLRLFIERCLTQPGGAKLIVTSREHVQVVSAALPMTRSIPLCDGLPEAEAMALLRELDPQGELGLRNAPEDDLRQATQLSNGIPRALEIIAGILQIDPATNLSRLVADRKLFGEQVVENLVSASHHHLDENERCAMEALAVLNRPIEETAVAYLLFPWYPNLDARASLRRLVSGYFVSVNRTTGEYSLHPIDRKYTYSHLPDDEELGKYNRRNLELRAADFYLGIRKPQSEWQSLTDLAPQLAEFEHRVCARDYDNACQLLRLIDYDYLYMWGHFAQLVALQEKLRGRPMRDSLVLANLDSLGRTYHVLGQFQQSIACYEQALSIAREIGDREYQAICLDRLGVVNRTLGQNAQAIGLLEDALTITRLIGDRRWEGVCTGDLGRAHHALGQLGQAIALYEDGLAIAQETSDHRREGLWTGELGRAHYDLGQFGQALGFYERALTITRRIGDRRREGFWLGNIGLVHYAAGQFRQAVASYQEALVIAIETGDRRREGLWISNQGYAFYPLREFDQMINLCEKALTIFRKIGYRLGESLCLLGISRALLANEEFSKARRYYEEAVTLDISETSHQLALVSGILLLHQCHLAAQESFQNAIDHCRALLDRTPGLYEPRYTLAAALIGQAVCNQRWSDPGNRTELLAPGLVEYRRALEITSAYGAVADARRDLELLRAAGIDGLQPVSDLLECAGMESHSSS